MDIKITAQPKNLQWLANDLMDKHCKDANNWNIVKDHLKDLPAEVKEDLKTFYPQLKQYLNNV